MIRLKILVCIAITFVTFQAKCVTPAPPALSAKSYILLDFQSGQVIAESESDLPLSPASLTKMMTQYVVSSEIAKGNISKSDLVMISENAWAKNFPESSKMFIEVGKEVSVDDLMKGLIISSGNDASVALAEHVAGSEDSFADLMNSYADKLSLTNTRFVNSHGLPANGHHTSARDMAHLARAIIAEFPEDYATYKVKQFSFNNIQQYNRNRLLWDRSLDVDGVKTGHTEDAGYCLVSSSIKDDMRLIAVVMGTRSDDARKIESKKLLTYGFRFFETVKPLKSNSNVHEIRIWGGAVENAQLGVLDDIWLTIPRGQKNKVKASYEVKPNIEAPLSKGTVVGSLFFQLEDKEIAKFPLVALNDIEEGGWWTQMMDGITRWFDSSL